MQYKPTRREVLRTIAFVPFGAGEIINGIKSAFVKGTSEVKDVDLNTEEKPFHTPETSSDNLSDRVYNLMIKLNEREKLPVVFHRNQPYVFVEATTIDDNIIPSHEKTYGVYLQAKSESGGIDPSTPIVLVTTSAPRGLGYKSRSPVVSESESFMEYVDSKRNGIFDTSYVVKNTPNERIITPTYGYETFSLAHKEFSDGLEFVIKFLERRLGNQKK